MIGLAAGNGLQPPAVGRHLLKLPATKMGAVAPAGVLAVVRSFPKGARGFETPYTGMVRVTAFDACGDCLSGVLMVV